MVDSMAGGDDVTGSSEELKEDRSCKPEDAEQATPEAKTREPHTWQWSVIFLCFYGFMIQLKPGEPFITPFLLSTEKNFTRQQITNEVNPVLSYSHMVVLVPVFLLTDFLRYKPVLVLQSLSSVSIWLLLLLGSTLLEMQFMEFFYGISMAARVAYSSYIFSLVKPEMYQRVASYSRSSVLLGVFTSSVLGQLLLSVGGMTYSGLSAVSLGLVSFGLLLSFCLPWPRRSMFFNRDHQEAAATEAELSKMKSDRPSPSTSSRPLKVLASWRSSVFVQMLKELRSVLHVPSLRLWSLWWVFNSTGYYLVLFYVHVLWDKVFPVSENQRVYNGAVEAASTLLGAITSFAAGFVKIRWNLWSELVIGIDTALQAGLLLLMGTTDNIWVCYVAYSFFRGFYQFLVPIATFQIASSLTKEMCALVFGVNTFLGTILKTIITIIVADKRGLSLPVHSQFLVYFFYFTLLTVLYLGCAVWVIVRHYRRERGDGTANEATPTELSPMESSPCETDCLANGAIVKA
ncbi:hypothetical protein JZ751_027895 [Albula glossodonta]|uniref:Solute carrier family 19 member 1 n=1 Tax=Albula glossodonta TaxID=121402 RepID=A0A8T2PIJ9_9TELE|nr:hypothetical protein JZ751_027895 [Albula glossodonta]